ncbi:MAG: ribosomal protein S18 acetylase RimI-like enzyme [Cyclobacteriaceae bacterium]|jgi:ribosomal protein S18 acetylase RimI-like enzyme
MIRKGEIQDLPRVLELIEELALYEKAPHEVVNTVERMEKDGFGDNPIFGFVVAEQNNTIQGAAIYYWRYSTWKGKRIYLEDLIVTESQRGLGLGVMLFDEIINIGKSSGASGMMWQVLDWNEPAINFYKKYKARIEEEWLNCSLDF